MILLQDVLHSDDIHVQLRVTLLKVYMLIQGPQAFQQIFSGDLPGSVLIRRMHGPDGNLNASLPAKYRDLHNHTASSLQCSLTEYTSMVSQWSQWCFKSMHHIQHHIDHFSQWHIENWDIACIVAANTQFHSKS